MQHDTLCVFINLCVEKKICARWRLVNWLSHMLTSATTSILCPRCSAKYRVVKLEADPGVKDSELTCLSCGGPLAGRDGPFILKYFLVDRPAPRQRRIN